MVTDEVLAMVSGVLQKISITSTEVQIPVGIEDATVEKVDGFKEDEGPNEGSPGGVVVTDEDGGQTLLEAVPNKTKWKVLLRWYANSPAASKKYRHLKIAGKLAVVRGDTKNMKGRDAKGLDAGEQRGMLDEGRYWGNIQEGTISYLIPGANFGVAEGLDGYKLVRVFLTLVITGGLREGDGGRNVLLVVKMGERWQRAG